MSLSKINDFKDERFENKCNELELNAESFDFDRLNEYIETCREVIPSLSQVMHFVINYIKSTNQHVYRRHLKFMVKMQEDEFPFRDFAYRFLDNALKASPEINYCLNMTSFLNLLNFILVLPQAKEKISTGCLLRYLEAYDIGIHNSQTIDYDPLHFMEVSKLAYNQEIGIFSIVELYVERMNSVFDGKFTEQLLILKSMKKHQTDVDMIVLELLRVVTIFNSEKDSTLLCEPRKKRKFEDLGYFLGDDLENTSMVLAQYSPDHHQEKEEEKEKEDECATTTTTTTSSSSSSSDSPVEPKSTSCPE